MEDEFLAELDDNLSNEFDEAKQVSVGLTQWDSIEVWDGYGNKIDPSEDLVTRVMDCQKRALNMVKEDGMMEETRKITVHYSADGVQGDMELSHEQLEDYGDSLQREIEAEFPGFEVETKLSLNDRVTIHAGDDYKLIHNVGSAVQQIIADHWQYWIDEITAQA
jgi:hypothetical protein